VSRQNSRFGCKRPTRSSTPPPKDQLAEAARLLALNLAHYQIRYGEIPLENFDQLMATQEIDAETERLVSRGMENLVGLLGLLINQGEAANETAQ